MMSKWDDLPSAETSVSSELFSSKLIPTVKHVKSGYQQDFRKSNN